MSENWPSTISTFKVTGRLVKGVADSNDSDQRPNFVPISGTKVTFTPNLNPPIVRVSSATPPVTVYLESIVAVTDQDGYLKIDADSERGVQLIWGLDPDLDPYNWTWTVKIDAIGNFPSRTFSIAGSDGGVFDLATLVPVPSSPGETIAMWTSVVNTATSARDQAVSAAASVNKGQPNGVAPLDNGGRVPVNNLPDYLDKTALDNKIVEQVEGVDPAAFQAAVENAAAGLDLVEASDPRLPRTMGDEAVAYSVTDESGLRSWIEVTYEGRPSRHAVDLLGDVAPIPREIGFPSEWAYAVTDAFGRVAFGIRHDGSVFPTGAVSSGATTFGGGHMAVATAAGVMVEDLATGAQVTIDAASPTNLHLDADRVYFSEAGVLRWAPVTGGVSLRVLASGIVAWGDSLTYANGGRWTTRLAELTGVSVVPRGVSGERAAAIASRQGGLSRMITVTGGTIPASGPVNVTADGVWVRPNEYQQAGVQNGTLAGVRGTITQTVDNSGVWQFTRTTAGDAVAVPAAVPWISDDSTTYRDWLPIFWPGRNNFPNDIGTPGAGTSATAVALERMVEFVGTGSRRFLVMPVINGTGEGIGTVGHDRVLAHETWLAETYPDNFVPIRRILIDHGLALAGLTPTAGDLEDIAADIVPRSLRVDYIHLTQPAYELVVAATLADTLTSKGWT